MAESASLRTGDTVRTSWHTLGVVSESLLLPLVSIASAFLGILLLTNPVAGSTPYLDLALVAVGSAALVISIAFRPGIGSKSATEPGSPKLPEEAPTAGTRVGQPRTVTSEPTPRRSGSVGSEWRVLSSPTDPGDETWLSWLPREHRQLGPATGDALPGYYAPARPGSLVAVPVRSATPRETEAPAPALASPAPRLHPARGSIRDQPAADRLPLHGYTEEELDRMFPPEAGAGSVFLAVPPNRVGLRGRSPVTPSLVTSGGLPDGIAEPDVLGISEEEGASMVYASGATEEAANTGDGTEDLIEEPADWAPRISGRASGSFGETGPAERDLLLEAMNPVPPHLRGPGAELSVGGHSHRNRGVPPATKSVCASCSKVVVNLRLSGPCPRCLRPLCDECLRDALTEFGHGWCIDCSPEPALSAS